MAQAIRTMGIAAEIAVIQNLVPKARPLRQKSRCGAPRGVARFALMRIATLLSVALYGAPLPLIV